MFGKLFKKSHLADYTQSRMSPFDEHALHKLLQGKNDLSILEIGSWMGAGSTQIFSRYAARLVCVDHWRGNENSDHKSIIDEIDPYVIFNKNIGHFRDKVIAIRADSSAIGYLLKDELFDFIFIDGDHRYKQTIQDIKNCLPKIKSGGIISGHDCEARLSELSRPFSTNEMDEDHIDSPSDKFIHCHPGVISSIHEMFGDDVELFADEKNKISLADGKNGFSTIWFKQI